MKIYNEYLLNSILANNNFHITSIEAFRQIATFIFERDEYPMICSLIREQQWEALQKINHDAVGFREYLSIDIFQDQEKSLYAVTSYDNDELWQDPQLIEVFRL